jgi:hypothetical protein
MTLIPRDGSKTSCAAYMLLTMGLVVVAIAPVALNLSDLPFGRGSTSTIDSASEQTTTVVTPTLIVDVRATATSAHYIGKLPFSKSHDTWSYTVEEWQGTLFVVINPRSNSVEDFAAFEATNQQLLLELAGGQSEVELVVTFNTLLTPDDFRTWAKLKGIRVKEIAFRHLQNPSQRPLVYPNTARDPEPIPAEINERIIGYGVYSLGAYIDPANLPELSADPLVLIADVTPEKVRRELISEGIVKFDAVPRISFAVSAPAKEQK